MSVKSYSVLNATTGSFFAAIFDGIKPAMRVKTMLIITSITPPETGNFATPDISDMAFIIILAGMHSNNVTPMPITPAVNPIIIVSALNTLDISDFEAPMLRSMPISFVRSRTEMYVMIPIMIDETTSAIATNAIKTALIVLMMLLTDDIISPT